MATDGRHIETSIKESPIDLVTHFKTFQTDTWTYLSNHILWM